MTTPILPITRMPRTYDPSLGVPLYWMNEQSGVLVAAVKAYFAHGAEPDTYPPPNAEQLALVIDYCRYVIYAPCWHGKDVKGLRKDIQQVTTLAELHAWIMRCLDIGIDPL